MYLNEITDAVADRLESNGNLHIDQMAEIARKLGEGTDALDFAVYVTHESRRAGFIVPAREVGEGHFRVTDWNAIESLACNIAAKNNS